MKNNLIILPLILLAVFIVHTKSPVSTSWDSRWSIPTAVSMIKEGNVNLDEFIDKNKPISKMKGSWTLIKAKGHYYTIFPLGTAIAALPIVYVINHFWAFDPIKDGPDVERIVASFLVALTALFIYLIAKKFTTVLQSLLISFIFSFCTSSWSIASRALWQYAPSMLMLAVTIYLFLLAKKKSYLIQFTGLTLAFSYLSRPLNVVSVIVLSFFVFFYYRRYFLYYLFWLLVVLTPFFLHNLATYNSLLPAYFVRRTVSINTGVFERLLGNLISPSRGFFVFSPVFLFSLWGIFLKIKNKQLENFDLFLAVIIFLHWIAMSIIPYWCGAMSFGQRYFCDVIPYFVYFLIPAVLFVFQVKDRFKKLITYIFLFFILMSFFIHFRGANALATWAWNLQPFDVKHNQRRAWNFRDIQFLRGLNINAYFKSYRDFWFNHLEDFQLGEKITIAGNAKKICFDDGWSYSEKTHIWSVYNPATILFKLGDKENDVKKCRLFITACVLADQEIEIFINKTFIGKLKFCKFMKTESIEFNSEVLRFNKINIIAFKVPLILEPQNEDLRFLGICLSDITINKE